MQWRQSAQVVSSSVSFLVYWHIPPSLIHTVHSAQLLNSGRFVMVALLLVWVERSVCFLLGPLQCGAFLFWCIQLLWLWCSGGQFTCYNLHWSMTFAGIDIVVKKLVAVVLSAVMWGPFWKRQHALFHIDNMAVVQVVGKLNAYDPSLCRMLWCLYFYSTHFQFMFFATHIPEVQNIAADALSRHNQTLFSTSIHSCSNTQFLHHWSICTYDNSRTETPWFGWDCL